jgi:hypothetical protein
LDDERCGLTQLLQNSTASPYAQPRQAGYGPGIVGV